MNLKTTLQWTPWWLLVLLVFFSLVASLDGVVFAEIIGRLSTLDDSVSQPQVVEFAVYALALRLFVFLGMYFNYQVKAKIEQVLNTRLKQNYLNNIYHSQEFIKPSESISTMTSDYEVISDKYFGVIFEIFGYLLMLITSIVYILSIDLKYGAIFVAVSLLALLPSFLFSQPMNKRTQEYLDSNQYLLARLSDTIHGLKTIKTYHQEKTIQAMYESSLNQREQAKYKMVMFQTFVTMSSSIISFVGRFVPVVLALYFIQSTQLTVGGIIAMFLASDRIDFPVRIISGYLTMAKSTQQVRQKVIINPPYEKSVTPLSNLSQIDLENVNFAFNDQKILQNINLNIQQGDKVLVIGPSGVGKSTLLDVIHGFLNPQLGQVKLKANGKLVDQSLTTFDSVSIIQQKPVIFNETIRFNISFSNDTVHDQELMALLRKVNLDIELGEQPLNLIVEEEGANLSGGQKQRIEIARALYHKPEIIFVDEMTSALDATNAKAMRELFWNSPATVIEIAHHFDQELMERASQVIRL